MEGKPLKDLVLEMVDLAKECNKRRLEIEKHYGVKIHGEYVVPPPKGGKFSFFINDGFDKLVEALGLPVEEYFTPGSTWHGNKERNRAQSIYTDDAEFTYHIEGKELELWKEAR